MTSPEDLLAALEVAGQQRVEDEAKLSETNDRLAELLAQAKAHPDVAMREAVERAGIGRTLGYKLINERRSD